MWVPETVNVPPPPVTVPALVLPSPQSMVAVKSPATLAVLASVKVATVPLKGMPAWAVKVTGVPVSTSASVTVAVAHAAGGGAAGADLGDRHGEGEAPLVRVGVLAGAR